jgi:hypothetical protein
MERFGTPLTAQAVGRTIAAIASGEVGRDGTVLGISGTGLESL